ncbi:pentulose/hexulose kinase [Natronococcus occultus SP4]|uniref:Pentulose/hexulose kinase n=2 Tax=Natronococcus occultus TaxID=29288 RepID=L0JXQ4_9EURY|nr:pentulose/hexulose kinase [Natronococcus occultus SP4]
MSDILIGIDAGTTAIKTAAFETDGTELVHSSRENPVTKPNPDWAEQDMDLLWAHTTETIKETVRSIPESSKIAAVAVTGQGGGCWLVDEEGSPVRNAIIWNDGRASDIVNNWRKNNIYDDLFERFGYGVFSGLALPILKWIENNEPETLKTANTLLGCKDWIRYNLTGELASEPTELSLINYDPVTEEFVSKLPKGITLPSLEDLLPSIKSPTAIAGKVTPSAAAKTELPEGTPVVTGVVDVAASAFGSGALTPGDCSVVAGTTLQIQNILQSPNKSPPPVGYTLALGINGMGLRAMGAMTGTPNLDWVRKTIAGGESFETVESLARSAPIGSEGVIYHPYLSTAGEKAPFVDPNARAGFTGLNPSHDRSHLLRAVYEGLSLSLRDCSEKLPDKTNQIRLCGGGARSTLLCETFADCLNTEVIIPAGIEMGAKGAAILAATANGFYENIEIAASEMIGIDKIYRPNSGHTHQYDALYETYTEITAALEKPWQQRASMVSNWESLSSE